jgi:hypothetical protein
MKIKGKHITKAHTKVTVCSYGNYATHTHKQQQQQQNMIKQLSLELSSPLQMSPM